MSSFLSLTSLCLRIIQSDEVFVFQAAESNLPEELKGLVVGHLLYDRFPRESEHPKDHSPRVKMKLAKMDVDVLIDTVRQIDHTPKSRFERLENLFLSLSGFLDPAKVFQFEKAAWLEAQQIPA